MKREEAIKLIKEQVKECSDMMIRGIDLQIEDSPKKQALMQKIETIMTGPKGLSKSLEQVLTK